MLRGATADVDMCADKNPWYIPRYTGKNILISMLQWKCFCCINIMPSLSVISECPRSYSSVSNSKLCY